MRSFFVIISLLLSIDRFAITEKLQTPPIKFEQQQQSGIVPEFTSEPDRFTGPIEWDLDALKSVQSTEPAHVVIGYSPKWCQFCPQAKEQLGTGDHDIRIEWRDEETPLAAAKFPDGRECGYPCLHYLQGNRLVRGLTAKNVNDLKAALDISPSAETVGTISAGSIDRAMVETFASLLRPNPVDITFGNVKPTTYGSSVTITFPAKFRLQARTSNGETSVRFTPGLTMSWGRIVSQQVDGLTYDGDRVVLDLPWCPDLSLDCR